MPEVAHLLNSMDTAPEEPVATNHDENDNKLEIEPGVSIFHFEHCAFRVQFADENNVSSCEVLQSANAKHIVGETAEFADTENVRHLIVKTFDTSDAQA